MGLLQKRNWIKTVRFLSLFRTVQKCPLSTEDLLIETEQKEGYYTVSDNGVTVALDCTLTPQLIEEGTVRELISKIQTMRKEKERRI